MRKQTNNNIATMIPLLLLILIDTMGVGIIFPVLSPLFMRPGSGLLPANASLAERDTLYGLLLGVFAFFMFFSTPILGDLSDRLGRKKVLLLCLFGTALSSFLCAIGIVMHSVSLLLFGRVIAGMSAGSQPIAQAAILDLSKPDMKAKNLGLVGFVSCIGFVIGPILGGFLSDSDIVYWFTFAMPFWADGLLAILNGILLVYTYTDQTKIRKAVKFSWLVNVHLFVEAYHNKNIFKLSIMILLYETGWSLYFQYISIYLLQKYNFTPANIGLFMSYMGFVLGVAFIVILPILARYVKERQIVLWSLLIAGITLFLPVIFPSQFSQWLIVAPLVIAAGLTWNASLVLFSNAVSHERQGWVMGVAMAAMSVSWIFGSLLTGGLGYISILLPFIVAAILMLLSGATLLLDGDNTKNLKPAQDTWSVDHSHNQ